MPHHTLADLRRFLSHMTKHRLRPLTALRILQIASPGGLDCSDISFEKRSQWHEAVYRLAFYDRPTQRYLPLPGFAESWGLQSPEQAASLARVFGALHRHHFGPLCMGALIHLTTQPLSCHKLSLLGWCSDIKNRPDALQPLIGLQLLRQDAGGLYHITATGLKVLLGQWGKAAQPSTARSTTLTGIHTQAA